MFIYVQPKYVVMGRTPFYRTSNKLEHHFQTLNKLKCVHLLGIELKHPIFGFERTNIEPNKAFTKFTKLLIELTRTSFFQISNELERVHLLEIELKHPIFAFEHRTSNIVRPITTICQRS